MSAVYVMLNVRSLAFRVYEMIFSSLSLCLADMEVQKMKRAMESLMAANEEKVVLGHEFVFWWLLTFVKETDVL